MNVHCDGPLQTVRFLFRIRNIKMAATARPSSLTLDPMGKMISKRFFSETTWIIQRTKLPRNDHWNIPLHRCVFFMPIGNPRWPYHRRTFRINISDPKKCFKMLLLWGPLGQLKPNCPGMISWKVLYIIFCFLCRSEIQDGHHRRT